MATAYEAGKIPVRKMNFEFGDVPRDYLNGNLAHSNFFNGLNLLFPEGERYFMHSVRDALKKIESPELAARAKGFFGQEAQHSIEHLKYFEILDKNGYEFRDELAKFDRFIIKIRKKLPNALNLSITAGCEHLTAISSQMTLTEPNIINGHPVMRDLMQWHAIEEIEHKSVAYDVYQEVYGSYFLRIFGYLIANMIIGGFAYRFATMFMRQEGYSKRKAAKLIRKDQRELLNRHSYLKKQFLDYFKPSFHPDQIEDEHLIEQARVDLAAY
ncbi:metal-dependent hydrolase [Bacterioplanoides sp.]|uniref:metal-dependent hydrolase n=1 Tax=Bacterioplanoides sp. TaxID=2066072 RepID=UPI003B0021E3